MAYISFELEPKPFGVRFLTGGVKPTLACYIILLKTSAQGYQPPGGQAIARPDLRSDQKWLWNVEKNNISLYL